MKLIALYSVFDGEELLEGSVRQIRPHVDFVLCSVQTVSYAGEVYEGGADKAYELKRQGLVDEVVVYTPQPAERPQMDELRKRFGATISITNSAPGPASSRPSACSTIFPTPGSTA